MSLLLIKTLPATQRQFKTELWSFSSCIMYFPVILGTYKQSKTQLVNFEDYCSTGFNLNRLSFLLFLLLEAAILLLALLLICLPYMTSTSDSTSENILIILEPHSSIICASFSNTVSKFTTLTTVDQELESSSFNRNLLIVERSRRGVLLWSSAVMTRSI